MTYTMVQQNEEDPFDLCESKKNWLRKMSAVKIYESDLDAVIMNYLVLSGNQIAALKFAEESNTPLDMPAELIEARWLIRNAIKNGQFKIAIDQFLSLQPKIFDEQPSLMFRLRLIELLQIIQNKETVEALNYARKYLAPLVNANPNWLLQLEKTMSLLAFNEFKTPKALDIIKELDNREEILQLVDKVFLDKYSLSSESLLENLVKNMQYTQKLSETVPHCISSFETGRIKTVQPSKNENPSQPKFPGSSSTENANDVSEDTSINEEE